jgi:hypothetical protein
MKLNESKGLTKGTRVYWRGDAADSGIITDISWDAVTITWNNGQVTSVHRGHARHSPSGNKDAYRAKAAVIPPDRIHLSDRLQGQIP